MLFAIWEALVVKRTSFLDKLVNRFRSGSGVRVAAGRHKRGRSETVEARAEDDAERGQVPARPAAEVPAGCGPEQPGDDG